MGTRGDPGAGSGAANEVDIVVFLVVLLSMRDLKSVIEIDIKRREMGSKIGIVVGRAVLVVALGMGAGLGFNAVRSSGGLPLVAAPGFYDNKVFVPCPEVLTEPEVLEPPRVLKWNPDRILVVDARDEEEFAAGHHEGAISFPYSVLFSPEPEEVSALASKAGKKTIIVCGDPEYESGRLLAADLMEAGLEQVYYVDGGCVALMGGEMCEGPP
jgi:rhodanese-related sulfurtransferase